MNPKSDTQVWVRNEADLDQLIGFWTKPLRSKTEDGRGYERIVLQFLDEAITPSGMRHSLDDAHGDEPVSVEHCEITLKHQMRRVSLDLRDEELRIKPMHSADDFWLKYYMPQNHSKNKDMESGHTRFEWIVLVVERDSLEDLFDHPSFVPYAENSDVDHEEADRRTFEKEGLSGVSKTITPFDSKAESSSSYKTLTSYDLEIMRSALGPFVTDKITV